MFCWIISYMLDMLYDACSRKTFSVCILMPDPSLALPSRKWGHLRSDIPYDLRS